jgi:hypothetical protein
MSHSRNMKYLVDNRIVYRRDPIKEEPTEVYDWGMYFENGTHGCYRLFTSKAKITTYKSLKWHLLTLWYLNPEMNKEQFARLAAYIVDKQNNFITFNVNEQSLNGVIEEVYNMELDTPPKNRARKVIFKDNCGLSVNEKLSIVGTIIGKSKKITEEDIYDAMLHINDNNQKITVSKIAKYLNVTTRTIYRTMSDQLNEEKSKLNNELK